MLAWIIVIALLLLFLLMPVGVVFRYQQQEITLKVKIGLFKLKILPAKAKAKPKAPKPKKEKVKVPKDQKKLRLNKDDIFTLLKLLFRTLRRFRKHLSIDFLRLYWTAAAEDPCDAVMQYGGLNAGLSTLMPYVHEVLKIRNEDICTAVDFEHSAPQIEAELAATLQVWEILLTVNCAAFTALGWYVRKKKLDRAAAKNAAQKGSE